MAATPTTSSPRQVELAGTVRTLRKEVGGHGAKSACAPSATGLAAAYGATIHVDYDAELSGHRQPPGRDGLRRRRRGRRSPATPNVHRAIPPVMGGEDFSYMLEARPGAFIFIGNGDTANLHHPAYDFNDEVDPARRELLGAAGRNGAGGLSGCAAQPAPAQSGWRSARETLCVRPRGPVAQ